MIFLIVLIESHMAARIFVQASSELQCVLLSKGRSRRQRMMENKKRVAEKELAQRVSGVLEPSPAESIEVGEVAGDGSEPTQRVSQSAPVGRVASDSRGMLELDKIAEDKLPSEDEDINLESTSAAGLANVAQQGGIATPDDGEEPMLDNRDVMEVGYGHRSTEALHGGTHGGIAGRGVLGGREGGREGGAGDSAQRAARRG